MLKTLMNWERSRLLDCNKGGLLALLLFPALLFVPWVKSGLFESPHQAALVVITIYSLMITTIIGGDTGHRTASWFWLCQKGFRSADIALAAEGGAFAFATAFILVGLIAYTTHTAAVATLELRGFYVTVIVLLTFTYVGLALLFLLNALKVQRKSELLIALAIVSFAEPGLLAHAPIKLGHLVHIALPPFADSFALARASLAHDWPGVLGHLLHVVVFISVTIWSGYLLHARSP